MEKNNKHLQNYEVDELKFLEALSLGISFKTNHKIFYSKQFGGRKHYEQTFQYELYSKDFFDLNMSELLRLGIFKIKK